MSNPIDNPGQIAAERDVVAMWGDDRVKAGREVIERLFRSGWGDGPPDEVAPEAGQAIDEYMSNLLFKAAASDALHPRFVRNFHPAYRWHGIDVPAARAFGDNPDNIYRLAGIAHGRSYRVTGSIVDREPANVSFTLVGNYGTSVTIQTVESHQLERADDGSFVITIDAEPAGGRPNHLTTAPNVKFLFVRDSMEDWATEAPYRLDIELVGAPGADPIGRDEMASRAVFRAREDVPLWHWFQTSFSLLRANEVKPVAVARGTGGLVTQGLARGWFELGEDDAIVVDYEPGGAGYVAIQLSNYLFRSLEADRTTSSLTRAQSAASGDGRIRAVISRTDPGVANWLDCNGFRQTLMMHRWQALAARPERPPHVVGRLVKLDDLAKALPDDTVWVDAAGRAAQRAARKAAYDRRLAADD